MNKSLFLIDGSALVYRAYFAFIRNPLVTARGEHTSAVYGFLISLFRIMDEFNPTHLLVVFDTKAPTFRHEIYHEYKSTRAKMPDDMADQLPRLKEVLDAMNIRRVEMEGLEADDLIGTYAVAAAAQGFEVTMVTGDKDFCQLVNDRIKMLLPVKTGDTLELLDREGVKTKMGVYPERVIDLLALMGDSSDNVPGIPGIGQVKALELLKRYHSLDGVLTVADKGGERGFPKAALTGKESALLSKMLVTIRTDADVKYNPDELAVREYDFERLRVLFKELEFNSLLAKLEKKAGVADQNQPEAGFRQNYTLVTKSDVLREILELARAKGELTIDTETSGLDPLTADLVGISLCVNEGDAFYIPVAHANYDSNMSLQTVQETAGSYLGDPAIAKCGQNIKFDHLILDRHGLRMANLASDPMIASYVLNPSARQHNLSHLSEEHLGYRMQPITDLIGTGKKQISFAEVPVDKAVFYSAEDADCTLRLKNVLEAKLRQFDLDDLYRRIEMPLVDVLAGMESEGVRVDVDYLKMLSDEMGIELEKYAEQIFRFAGEEFNINSTQQLADILFSKLKLRPQRMTGKKTGYSTDQGVLEKLADEHPLPRLILEHRHYSKLKSTYVDALPALRNPNTGRVHTSFNQTVTATGRLSSSDPNLQNIPIRTEKGAQIRKAFVPRGKDFVLLSADYSQIELRIMAHYADDQTMIAAFHNDEDIHARTASEVFGVKLDDVTSDMRRRAKTANFAVIYGVSAYGLSQQSDMSVSESSQFIDLYFNRYQGIKRYIDQIIAFARANGHVSTLLGRRRYIPDIESSNRTVRQFAERTAINTPIQGTAADIIKLAMISIHRLMSGMKSKMILQVHDELVLDVHRDELDTVKEIVRSEMEGAVSLKVPLKADSAIGDNWLECK